MISYGHVVSHGRISFPSPTPAVASKLPRQLLKDETVSSILFIKLGQDKAE